MPSNKKRENFEVSPEQADSITHFQQMADFSSRKDAMLAAIKIASQILERVNEGMQVYLCGPDSRERERLLLPFGCKLAGPKYLVPHDHAWKRQLFVKGRNLPVSSVWVSMKTNNQTADEAANDWDLPVEAIYEIEEYCERNKDLLQMEAAEEKRLLQERGIGLEPKNPR